MSIALAKLLATVSGSQQQQDAGATSSSTAAFSSTTAASSAVTLPPELAAAIPEHIKAVVPVPKLVAQCAFFKIPSWVAIPAVALHLDCQRDGTRMAPLALDRYPTYLIGSGSVCDFQMDHPSTSRVHCALAYHGEKQCFVVVDLQSTNGTRVDGKRVEPSKPVPLPVGAVLQVGHSLRRYIMTRGLATKEGTGRGGAGAGGGGAVAVEGVGSSATSGDAGASKQDGTLPEGPSSSKKRDREEPDPEVQVVPSSVVVPEAAASAPPPAGPAVATTAAPSPPVPEVTAAQEAEDHCPRLLRHILFKHKDTRNPKSANPANKGEAITRTQAEALALAIAIRGLYTDPKASGNRGDGDDAPSDAGCWTEARFKDAAASYSECASSKKGGLLGVVRRGDFAVDFEGPAFALREAGTISSPFATDLGVHLVFFCHRCPEETTAPA